MAGESSKLQREIESFRLSTRNISDKINGAGVDWKDRNYDSLKAQIEELAKNQKQ